MARKKAHTTFEKRQRERKKERRRIEKLEKRLQRNADKKAARSDAEDKAEPRDSEENQHNRLLDANGQPITTESVHPLPPGYDDTPSGPGS